jgi:flavin-dependent dehydrogenase
LNREITITGGGLSGLALASALRIQEIPVMVIEAGRYPRHRVCGEFISGVSASTLEVLGIARLFDEARKQRTLAWFERGRLIHNDRLPEPALGISRYQLDERLRDHVESLGVIVRTGIKGSPQSAEGHVWAAGRRPSNGPWIGLKAHVRGIAATADLEMHAGSNGYAGLAGVEEGWTNVCGLFRLDRSIRTDSSRMLAAYLRAGGNFNLAERLDACEWRADSISAVAGFQLGYQQPLPGVLALGDAESMIPPFTGNGMSMAFQAAELAVVPLAAWSRGESSWQEAVNDIRVRLRRRFSRRLTVAATLHAILMKQSGRNLVRGFADAGLLPFQTMLAFVR